jgi:aminobenzoyl-glutamate utilization protein A
MYMQPSLSSQSSVMDWIGETISKMYSEIVSWRRDFHQYPEPGWCEYRTSAKIANLLESWGWKIFLGEEVTAREARMGVPSIEVLERCEERARLEGVSEVCIEKMKGGQTGVIAEWKTKREGPVFVFRFDIDSNELKENTSTDHIPVQIGFSSKHEDCMHACGHDGHTAMGLAVAKWISCNQNLISLKGTIRLIFQPAEEGCRGARAIVEKGWLDDADYFLSGHIGFRSFDLEEIVLNTTGFLATTKWDATFTGQAAHAGGEPEQGKNALLAASTAALNLHAISRHSQGVSRVNVGKLIAGSGRNVIPSNAYMQIETRGETDEINQYASREVKRILEASAMMYGVNVRIEKVGEAGQAAGSLEFRELLADILKDVTGVTKLVPQTNLGASEDVTFMLKEVEKKGGKGLYILLGSPLRAMHHQSKFDFDENVLHKGAEAYIRTLIKVLGSRD